MTPDPTRRSERAKQAILDATRELLAEVGYVRLTVEAIAARAGAGKQTIYRWWPSKGAVAFDALLDGNIEGGRSPLIPDSGDVKEDFRALLHGSVEEMTNPARGQLLRTIVAEVQHDPDLAEELEARLLRPQFDAAIQRIRAGQQAGQIRDDLDPEIVMEMLYGPIFQRWLLRTAPLDPSYVDHLLAQVFDGIAPLEP
jgi:AcrR family transcriptional regulator